MSIHRSSNCSKYTDHVSLLVDATATVPGDEARCSVTLPLTYSCQTRDFEAPDAITRSDLEAKAKEELSLQGCDTDAMTLSFQTNLMGAQHTEYSGEKLVKLGMTSNCYEHGNDINDATHNITARCRPMYDMTDANGKRVRDFSKVIHANLGTCDLSDEAMPQVMEDIRKVAALNSKKNGFTIDRPEDLACDISAMPFL